MSEVSVLKSAIEFTRNGVSVFSAIGNLIPGETRLLGSRVGLGFAVLSGLARVTSAVPGLTPGNLLIEQSIDGTNWELTNNFLMLPVTGVVPFSVKIMGKFIRARFNVTAPEVMTLRFGAHLRVTD